MPDTTLKLPESQTSELSTANRRLGLCTVCTRLAPGQIAVQEAAQVEVLRCATLLSSCDVRHGSSTLSGREAALRIAGQGTALSDESSWCLQQDIEHAEPAQPVNAQTALPDKVADPHL